MARTGVVEPGPVQPQQTITPALDTRGTDAPRPDAIDLIIGVSGARRNAAVAACVGGRLTAFCEQERLVRVRSARLDPGIIPDESLDAVLRLTGCRAADIVKYAIAGSEAHQADLPSLVRID